MSETRDIKRLKKEDAILVAIDFQEKLMPAMYDPEKLEDKMVRLAAGLKALEIPKIVTQQYTRGLGDTIPSIKEALGEFTAIDKASFSACGNEEFMARLKDSGRKTVILTGIETHICVEQTALDLMEMGYDVFLVTDCVQSRDKKNSKTSQKRLAGSGAVLTSYESVLYELLVTSKAPAFKTISAVVK